MKKKIYPTDNTEEVNERINSRARFYQNDLTNEWKDLIPKIYKSDEGEEILEINGLEVMAAFETPYMKKLAEIVTDKGGDILNVGYGLGIIDGFIEDLRTHNNIEKHHIIELNTKIFNSSKEWRVNHLHKNNIFLHKGNWSDLLSNFNKQFTGIIYDAFPLKEEDLCRDFLPFLEKIIEYKLLKSNGVITFFFDSSNGFGNDFIDYCNSLGIKKLEFEKVKIKFPKNRKPQGWSKQYFLAPILTNIKYNNE